MACHGTEEVHNVTIHVQKCCAGAHHVGVLLTRSAALHIFVLTCPAGHCHQAVRSLGQQVHGSIHHYGFHTPPLFLFALCCSAFAWLFVLKHNVREVLQMLIMWACCS